jgi:serine/tyrosine/threonine adenylyltransferase
MNDVSIAPRIDSVPTACPQRDLESFEFQNTFVERLPGDVVLDNVPRQVRNAAYTRVDPTPVREPRIVAWSDSVGALLGLARPRSTDGVEARVFGGNTVLSGMRPYAARYGGHQFGHWAGQLGDGRAITLAELIGCNGERFELQLKGAGKTPYSRTADGRAVLRSSVREFMCSEAMHHLGIPTTRALSLVTTGEIVVRDMFYDGKPQPEPGAIVCRVAPTFVRFGNFQIHTAYQELDELRALADYVIDTHFPQLGGTTPEKYVRWFEEICRRTAALMVDWMRVGFVHGVMNTDNMSILGLTIDYGPYGWLEGYDPNWTPNTTDAQGRRYCYGNQPSIGLWNVVQLANALIPLVGDKTPLERALSSYGETFASAWRRAVAEKLGLSALDREGDDRLVNDLFELLQAVETDMTLFFRSLAEIAPQDIEQSDYRAIVRPLERAYYSDEAHAPEHIKRTAEWLRRYGSRVRDEGVTPAARTARMKRANPKYVLRNYLAQQAIEALERGDASVLERLMTVLQHPYDEQPEHDELAARRPEWARHKAGCSALSCSS